MKYQIILPIGLAIVLAGCGKQATQPVQPNQSSSPTTTTKDVPVTTTQRTFPGVLPDAQRLNQQATITLANGDQIVMELFGDQAPKAASNFISLVKDKFYDGLTFHRVEPGFVVQGGDPKGNGTGGPGYQFEDEKVTRDYTRGMLAMANSGPNTNGSQFFIMLADTPGLPKNYTIFGQVTKGMESVDKIKIGDVMTSIAIQPKS